MSEIDWDKAPEGASHFCNGDWFKKEGGKWCYWFDGARSWTEAAYADPANFSWWGLRIERPSTAWSGEGLPPVGLPVEWHSDNQTGWQEVVVLSYHEDDAWIQRKGNTSIIVGNPSNFRPIRTAEQIAADEREAAIEQIISAYEYKEGACTHKLMRDQAARFYDAGLYRKP